MNLTQKIIGSHLVSGTMTPGSEIGLRIDQTLTQDATGTMAWLQFEALGIPRVKTDISLSYVDHNTLQMNFRNPDDHRFLRTVAAKFGGVYSGPGTGICHQLHLENFAPRAASARSPWARAGFPSRWRWRASPTISPCPRSCASS